MFLLQSCANLGAACAGAHVCTCGCAAVRGSCVHPQLSGKEAAAFRRKMIYCNSGYGTENILKKSAVSKGKNVQSFAKTANAFKNGNLLGRN